MTAEHECTVVLLTPAGRSAVAVLLVEGSGAGERVGRRFRPLSGKPLIEAPADRILVGRFKTVDDDCGEEVVVCRRGAETIEVHCHGGRTAAAKIVESLVDLGCRECRWEDHATELEDDFIAAEARTALAHARTDRTAAILLDQYNGALREAIGSIAVQLQAGRCDDAAEILTRLVAHSRLGLHLTQPWRVVIAGRPNVGKSSLINALLGYQRAIVYEQPGTTRDAVTALTAIDGWPVELIDTAGLRASDDEVERAGVELTWQQMSRADLIVLVSDASQPWCVDDERLCEGLVAPLLVHNKSDLPSATDDHPPGLATSALIGEGIDGLVAEIGKRLVPDPLPDHLAVPFTARQSTLLEGALDAAEQGNPEQAISLLRRVAALQRSLAPTAFAKRPPCSR